MAIATDGSLLVNALSFTPGDDLQAAVRAVLAHGGPVFVGVVVPPSDAQKAMCMIDDAAAEIAARVRPTARKSATAKPPRTSVAAEQVAAYIAALRVQRASRGKHDREAAEQKVAAIWFVMDVATQNAATVEAARAELLEPRTDRHGTKLYPVVRAGRVRWVSIPDRD